MTASPHNLAKTVTSLHGEAGIAWLRGLSALIAACEQRWSLRALPQFPHLSYHYVAPARRADGTEVVLKLGVRGHDLSREIAALRLFDGAGAVCLCDADESLGVLLLEHLQPGMSLAEVVDEEAATAVAATVMRALWRPVPEQHSFPAVAGWAAGFGRLRERFGGGTGPLPPALVERAERLFDGLLRSMASPVLLHGDLHHGNIVAAGRRPWLAIDPKGVIGEPAYEAGSFLRNPLPHLLAAHQPDRVIARRVDRLADLLGFDRQRLPDWGLPRPFWRPGGASRTTARGPISGSPLRRSWPV